MDKTLCRTCGKCSEQYVNIFKIEGLQNKIETCLPIVISSSSLLPDTLCTECYENVNSYHNFIKKCLQSIIILESHYGIVESCLKARRRTDKACLANFETPNSSFNSSDLDETLYNFNYCREMIHKFEKQISDTGYTFDTNAHNYFNNPKRLVNYDSSDSELNSKKIFNTHYYSGDDKNQLIDEINARSKKRKTEQSIANSCTKIFKLDSHRRKKRIPIKINYLDKPKIVTNISSHMLQAENLSSSLSQTIASEKCEISHDCDKNTLVEACPVEVVTGLPQPCLLCDAQFLAADLLAIHVFAEHGIDMTRVIANEPVIEHRKENPVGNSELKIKSESLDSNPSEGREEAPVLQPNYTCPMCPLTLSNRFDLFHHLRVKHPTDSSLICGLCMHFATNYQNLTEHIAICKLAHPIKNMYICKVCRYSDENVRSLENHILVHDFLINLCIKDNKVFDPCDYLEINSDVGCTKTISCGDCDVLFDNFKAFSTHRRTIHEIFHCDLCNKFYGRNSHLWKHVNRLHKGHPSITCQLCKITSASKYQLAYHFNKTHTTRLPKTADDEFFDQTIEQLDLQDLKGTFFKENFEQKQSESESKIENTDIPQAIDTKSDLYTSIITNYTPPNNDGEYRCPKCAKGFHKKQLLKKHKKNCRPRLQKDLLTRCKSCSRIFKDRQSLTKHLTNYHSEYGCEICGQKVQSKCEIISHIRFSHPNSQLHCHCGNVLRNTQDLRDHQKNHSTCFVCQFCGDLLVEKIKLKMHILSLHRRILRLSCGICLKLFENQHVLRDHVRLAHKSCLTAFSCVVCGKNYGSKWKTYDHINKSHGPIFKACKTCLEVFDSDEGVQQHYIFTHGNGFKDNKTMTQEFEEVILSKKEKGNNKIPTKNKPKYNEKRPLKANGNSSLTTRKKKKKEPIEVDVPKRTVYENDTPASCEICHKSWPGKKHLWQHYIRCHKKAAATICGICLCTNTSYETLQKHLEATHPNLLHKQGTGSSFICRVCGRYHNASSKLKLHMAVHERFVWELEINSFPSKETEINGTLENTINFESLIEQVELSSEEETDQHDIFQSEMKKISDSDREEQVHGDQQNVYGKIIKYENDISQENYSNKDIFIGDNEKYIHFDIDSKLGTSVVDQHFQKVVVQNVNKDLKPSLQENNIDYDCKDEEDSTVSDTDEDINYADGCDMRYEEDIHKTKLHTEESDNEEESKKSFDLEPSVDDIHNTDINVSNGFNLESEDDLQAKHNDALSKSNVVHRDDVHIIKDIVQNDDEVIYDEYSYKNGNTNLSEDNLYENKIPSDSNDTEQNFINDNSCDNNSEPYISPSDESRDVDAENYPSGDIVILNDESTTSIETTANASRGLESNPINIYARKPEVLESAIQSICFDNVAYAKKSNNMAAFCELEAHNCNARELQTAVDSIL